MIGKIFEYLFYGILALVGIVFAVDIIRKVGFGGMTWYEYIGKTQEAIAKWTVWRPEFVPTLGFKLAIELPEWIKPAEKGVLHSPHYVRTMQEYGTSLPQLRSM